jgi:hypothetical protein
MVRFIMLSRHVAFALCLLPCVVLAGQTRQQNSVQAILDKTESSVSLTANGTPFHTEMKISGAHKESQYEGTVAVDWVSRTRYRIEIRSAEFHQIHIVDGDQIQEQTEGDFYPGWLHSFVTALLDPLSVKSLLVDPKASLGASRSSNGQTTRLCIDRDESPGGIRDDMTWSGVCITNDGLLLNAHSFVSWMDFSDHKDFAGKKVARSYSTSTGSYEEILGKLTSLRPLQAAEVNAIRVTKPTPKDKQMGFAFISTKAEEARLASAKPFDWPPVREGKTEGYMIVHALTDVTGQVRETSKYNSDNPGLEAAGRQAAMGYKFEPMLVDGVPVQMEMPLVLHFTSRVVDPLPVLKGAELLRQIKACNASLVSDIHLDATVSPTRISVDEEGELTGESFGPQVDAGTPAVVITLPPGISHGLKLDCRFAPLTRNGVVTYYHGDLLVLRNK